MGRYALHPSPYISQEHAEPMAIESILYNAKRHTGPLYFKFLEGSIQVKIPALVEYFNTHTHTQAHTIFRDTNPIHANKLFIASVSSTQNTTRPQNTGAQVNSQADPKPKTAPKPMLKPSPKSTPEPEQVVELDQPDYNTYRTAKEAKMAFVMHNWPDIAHFADYLGSIELDSDDKDLMGLITHEQLQQLIALEDSWYANHPIDPDVD